MVLRMLQAGGNCDRSLQTTSERGCVDDYFSFLGRGRVRGCRLVLVFGGEAKLSVQIVQFVVYTNTQGLALHPAAI